MARRDLVTMKEDGGDRSECIIRIAQWSKYWTSKSAQLVLITHLSRNRLFTFKQCKCHSCFCFVCSANKSEQLSFTVSTSSWMRHAAWMTPRVQKAWLRCPDKEKVPVMHKPRVQSSTASGENHCSQVQKILAVSVQAYPIPPCWADHRQSSHFSATPVNWNNLPEEAATAPPPPTSKTDTISPKYWKWSLNGRTSTIKAIILLDPGLK